MRTYDIDVVNHRADVGRTIALWRSKRKLSLRELSVLSGFSSSTLQRWESGEVVPEGEALAAAKRWAETILECSPMSVRATKQVVMRSLDVPSLEMAMRNLTYPAFVAMTQSEDTVEGPRAFAEKRKPNWKGK